MSRVGKEQSKRLLALHGWSGTLLGLFLYVVLLTGAVAVFALEIGQWSAGGIRSAAPLDRPLDTELRQLADTVNPSYLDELFVYGNSGGALRVTFHTHAKNPDGEFDELGVWFTIDPNTFEVIDQFEGYASDMPSDQEGALDDFITNLHINLHAPEPWGLYATGILGFVMLIAVISGVILHKHLIKDMFLSPRLSNILLNKRDRHILASTWGLPFGFILAFTGTFFSFAGSMGIPLLAMVAFGGDQEALFETVIGAPPVVDERPAPTINLDEILAESRDEAGTVPTSVIVSDWGRADAFITVLHPAEESHLNTKSYTFNGATGEFYGQKPPLGTAPSIGGDMLGLMGPLHFGTFGGLLSKIVWFALGLSMCYVTASGLHLWTERRSSHPSWAWMNKAIAVTVYGTPIALVTGAYAFFVSYLSGGNAIFWTPSGFLFGTLICMGAGFCLRYSILRQTLVLFLSASMVTLPIVRMLLGGPEWIELFKNGQPLVLGMDLALIAAGVLIYFSTTGWLGRQTDLSTNSAKVAAE